MARWPVRKIYLYAVCLISILFMLFGMFSAIDSFVNALFPVNYGPAPADVYRMNKPPQSTGEDPLPAEVLREQQRFYEQQQRETQRRDMARGMGKVASSLFIALPVFLFHWRQTRPDD